MRQLNIFLLGLAFILAGINHFLNTQFYISIMPSYISWHAELVIISGIFEILGGLSIWIEASRKYGGYFLCLLTIAVFPANINMAIHADDYADIADVNMLYFRLPMQFAILAWIYFSTIKSTSSYSN